MSEMIVLDNHIWFWFVNGDGDRLPENHRKRIEQAERVGISPVSCFEIALARQKGKLALPCETHAWLEEALEPAGIEIFPMTPSIASRAVNLTQIQKRPL